MNINCIFRGVRCLTNLVLPGPCFRCLEKIWTKAGLPSVGSSAMCWSKAWAATELVIIRNMLQLAAYYLFSLWKVDGDVVAVELHAQDKWAAPADVVRDSAVEALGAEGDQPELLSSADAKMPTGLNEKKRKQEEEEERTKERKKEKKDSNVVRS